MIAEVALYLMFLIPSPNSVILAMPVGADNVWPKYDIRVQIVIDDTCYPQAIEFQLLQHFRHGETKVLKPASCEVAIYQQGAKE
jgi:hypothetical protein